MQTPLGPPHSFPSGTREGLNQPNSAVPNSSSQAVPVERSLPTVPPTSPALMVQSTAGARRRKWAAGRDLLFGATEVRRPEAERAFWKSVVRWGWGNRAEGLRAPPGRWDSAPWRRERGGGSGPVRAGGLWCVLWPGRPSCAAFSRRVPELSQIPPPGRAIRQPSC